MSSEIIQPPWLECIPVSMRILALLVLILAISLILKPFSYLVLSVVLVVELLALRVGSKQIKPMLIAYIPAVAITLVLHLLFGDTEDGRYFDIHGISVSSVALKTGLLYCWRITLFWLAALTFVRMITPDQFTETLWRLLLPLKRIGLPIDALVLTLSLALKFVPELIAQYRRIRFAQIARGAVFSGTPVRRTSNFRLLIVPVVIAVLQRAAILSETLVLRGWGLSDKRTFLHQERFSLASLFLFLGLALLGIFLIFIP